MPNNFPKKFSKFKKQNNNLAYLGVNSNRFFIMDKY